MKSKFVLWGTNAENEKVLIAAELQVATSKVKVYTFQEDIASDEFVTKMMQEWREGKEVAFPEGFTAAERDLSTTEGILPEGLKADRPDLVSRAQNEWQFAVLSHKLNEAYRQELAEFKEKVAALSNYDHKMWDGLRQFWDKVQVQVRERNLLHQHADTLRDGINELFGDMKKLRERVNLEFTGTSARVFEEMNSALDRIESKITAGSTKLAFVFDELKTIQRKYRDAKMTNEHRNKLWDRLDGLFKSTKEKRFGPAANEGSVVDRHERRLQGLNEAIARMEDSIRRDEDELNFQKKKVAATEGQLEAQIRMAKIKMVEERLASKREKLQEFLQTRVDVEKQIATSKDKEAKRAEKDAERQKFEQAKEKARAEISAKATKIHPEKQDSLFEAASTVLGEVLENALDTMKAVAAVASEKAEDVMEAVEDKIEHVVEAIVKKDKDEKPDQEDKVAAMTEEPTDAADEPAQASKQEEVKAEFEAQMQTVADEPAPEAEQENGATETEPASEVTQAEASSEPTAEATTPSEEPAAEDKNA